MPLDFTRIRASVIGAGRSGRAAAKLLRQRLAAVFVSEIDPGSPELTAELERLGAEYEFGGHTAKVLDSNLIVVSPGVRADVPILRQASGRGIRVISEVELAYQSTTARIVAVTGTNGKSTTVSMIGAIMEAAGIHTLTGGNLAPGRPLTELVLEATARSVIVAEVSTFQIETFEAFAPAVAVITNITPDHLDRHPSFAAYATLKGRLLANQGEREFAVLNGDDPNVETYTAAARSIRLRFSTRARPAEGAWSDGSLLRLVRDGSETDVMPVSALKVPGRHNVENALAAIAAASAFEVPPSAMRVALSSFAGVPHRLETVAMIAGVTYVNNSMCTNAAAGVSSLRAFDRPLVVIAGGRDKGLDLSPYLREIADRARCAVLVGEVRDRLATELRSLGLERVRIADDLAHAVSIAREEARPGDVVILAPGCSSFDMFRDFEDRGDQFRRLVRESA